MFTDPAPYDMAGTLRFGEVKEPIRIDLGALPFAKTLQKNDKGEWLIPLYSDLKRHLIVDETVNALGNELQAQRFVERDVFLTPRLWGVGSTAPYGHNGSFRMLDEIIAAHGGDARFARDAYHGARSRQARRSHRFPALARHRGAMMRIVVCILALLAGLAGARAGEDRQKPLGDVPLMHEEAEAAGLRSVYDGPWEFFVGGGGAALDCDGSGFPSVFLAGGKNPARLFVNKSKAGGPLKFEEKALDIGADPKLLTNVIGAYPLDIDGDGHMDLFVLRVGGNLLLKGGPDCTFTLANHEWNFDGDTGWTTSFAAEWEPGQKFPTLAIGHYVDRDAPGSPWGTCADNSLYRPQAGDKPDYSCAYAARARLLRALDAVHRLEQVRHAIAARLERPAILPRRRRADVAHRAGQDAEALLARRRLAAFVDLRHGHRRRRSRRLGLPAIFPDLDGRREAAEARPRRGWARRSARLSRHRRRSRRDRAYSLCRRRQAAVDRLARRIRRLQQ